MFPAKHSLTEMERRQLLVDFADGNVSLAEARRQLGGVSRQRVFQIVKSYGLVLTRTPLGLCRREDLDDYVARRIDFAELLRRARARGRVGAAGLKRQLREAGLYVHAHRPNRPQPQITLSEGEIADYLNGRISNVELARLKGCSVAGLNNTLARQGVRRHVRVRADAFVISDVDAARLVAGLMTKAEIARSANVSYLTVHKAALRQGLVSNEKG